MKVLFLLLASLLAQCGAAPGPKILTGNSGTVLASPIGGTATFKAKSQQELDQCPLIPAKSSEECHGLRSTCWSPGGPDVDCTDDELCCFDGCTNVCFKGELCHIEYEVRYEDVTKETCQPQEVEKCQDEICTPECKTVQLQLKQAKRSISICLSQTERISFIHRLSSSLLLLLIIISYLSLLVPEDYTEWVEKCEPEGEEKCEYVEEKVCQELTVSDLESFECDSKAECSEPEEVCSVQYDWEAYEDQELVCEPSQCEDGQTQEICHQEPVCMEKIEYVDQERQVCQRVPKRVCQGKKFSKKGKHKLFKRHLLGKKFKSQCRIQMQEECSTQVVKVPVPWKECTEQTHCRTEPVPCPEPVCHIRTVVKQRKVPRRACVHKVEQCLTQGRTECQEQPPVCQKVPETSQRLVEREECEDKCEKNCDFVTEEKCTSMVVTMEYEVPVEKCEKQ